MDTKRQALSRLIQALWARYVRESKANRTNVNSNIYNGGFCL